MNNKELYQLQKQALTFAIAQTEFIWSLNLTTSKESRPITAVYDGQNNYNFRHH